MENLVQENMRGYLVGLPLTLLQLSLQGETGASLHVADILNNFALASAIYDADRIEASLFDESRLPTRYAALFSSLYFASVPATQPLVPCVWILHLAYDAIKPRIAAVKPFFVAVCWTIAVYYVPVLRNEHPHVTIVTPAALFLCFATFSHIADISDIHDDEEMFILTPAVRMGRNQARSFSIALIFATCLLHEVSDAASPIVDCVLMTAIAILLFA